MLNIRNDNSFGVDFLFGAVLTGAPGQNIGLISQVVPGVYLRGNTLFFMFSQLTNYLRQILGPLGALIPDDSIIPPYQTFDIMTQLGPILNGLRVYLPQAIPLAGDDENLLAGMFEFWRFINAMLNPPAGSTISYSIYFISPLASNLHFFDGIMDNIFASQNFTVTFTGDANNEEQQVDAVLEDAAGDGDVGDGGAAGEGVDGSPLMLRDGRQPFSLQINPLEDGFVNLQINALNQNTLTTRGFTRARITRDVVGDFGFKSYCPGNRTILPAQADRSFFRIGELLGETMQIQDQIMPNIRYRYDIELADSCFEYATYQSVLYSNIQSSVIFLRTPTIDVNPPDIRQSTSSAQVSFSVNGSWPRGGDSIQMLVDALSAVGQGEWYQEQIEEQRALLNSLICFEIIRTNLTNGDSWSFGIYRGPNCDFVDAPETCRSRRIPPMNPRSDYVYEINTFVAKGEIAFSNAARTTVNPQGLSVGHLGLQRDPMGNILPDPQQSNLIGQDSYVPGPLGFWPTGRRHYLNVSGVAPTTPSGELISSVGVENFFATSHYTLNLAFSRKTSGLGYCKVDVYCLYTHQGLPSSAFFDSWPIPSTDQPNSHTSLSINKNKVFNRIPVFASSVRFKVVAVNAYGQVIDTGESRTIRVPLSAAGTGSEPIIEDSFLGQRFFSAQTRHIPGDPRIRRIN